MSSYAGHLVGYCSPGPSVFTQGATWLNLLSYGVMADVVVTIATTYLLLGDSSVEGGVSECTGGFIL